MDFACACRRLFFSTIPATRWPVVPPFTGTRSMTTPLLSNIKYLCRDVIDFFRMPKVSINLRLEMTAGNDPFFARVVKRYYQETQSWHPKFPLVHKYAFGIAMYKLPKDFHS